MGRVAKRGRHLKGARANKKEKKDLKAEWKWYVVAVGHVYEINVTIS